jgi:hypothetical protein
MRMAVEQPPEGEMDTATACVRCRERDVMVTGRLCYGCIRALELECIHSVVAMIERLGVSRGMREWVQIPNGGLYQWPDKRRG